MDIIVAILFIAAIVGAVVCPLIIRGIGDLQGCLEEQARTIAHLVRLNEARGKRISQCEERIAKLEKRGKQ